MVVGVSVIELSKIERVELSQRAASQASRADAARRARLILLLEAGDTWAQLPDKPPCNDAFIDRRSKRFGEERLAGLFSRHAGQEASTLTPALEAKILEWTVKRKPAGSTHSSTRRLAEQLRISHMMVARVWRKHRLQPQRLEGYMTSDDPDFEQKAADIIALYLHPPQHAAEFCVDEKTVVQALDRLDPVPPLSPGRTERHGFGYYRYGTLSLYAAFNNKTGQVKDFLAAHKHVHLHFTPTYSSWLKQVELWFSKIERDVIARGAFTTVPDLRRKLIRHIHVYNQTPKTVKWKYFDPTRRITPTSAVTVH